jgi:hypothetical protein
MSRLGQRGISPAQTLRSEMMKNHADIFQMDGQGEYEIGDAQAALRNANVRRAILYLIVDLFDQYQKLTRAIVRKRMNLSNPNAKRSKSDLEMFEKQLARIARFYSNENRKFLVQKTPSR